MGGASQTSPAADETIRRLLLERLRYGGLLTMPFVAIYSVVDVLFRAELVVVLLSLKAIPLVACAIAITGRLCHARVRDVAVLCVLALAGTGCVSSLVVMEVSALPILMTSLGLTAGIFLPWGVGAQAVVASSIYAMTVGTMLAIIGTSGVFGTSVGVGSLLGMFVVLANSAVVASMMRSLIERTLNTQEAKAELSASFEKRLDEANRKIERRGLALERALEEAEKANQSKSRFLASVSHELRTPLTSILGFAAMLRNGAAGPVNAKQLDYASEICTSAEHLLRLLGGILTHARIEAHQDPLQLSEVPIDLLVQVACRQMAPVAIEKGLTIRRCPPSGAYLVADRQKVLQVMLNLITNAIKFTERGGEIGTEVMDLGDAIEIVVWDRGIGLRPDDLERVFRPFEQVRDANRTSQKGAGLGLSISKHLVEQHGGTIRAESELGRGSRFIVSLPKAAKAAQPAAAA